MNHIRAGATLFAAVMLVTGVSQSLAQEVNLKWKFNKGAEGDYVVGRLREAAIDLNGNQLEIGFSSKGDLHWVVDSVADDGSATLTANLTRLQIGVKSPIEDMNYDTLGDEPEASAIWEDLRGRVEALMSNKLTLVVASNGSVKSIDMPPALVEALDKPSSNPQADRFMAGVVDAKGIENMIRQMFVLLPDEPAKLGTSWEYKEESERPPFGKLIVERTYKYAGKDEGSGGVDMVELGSKVEFVIADGAEDLSVKISEQSSKGTAEFDSEEGRGRDMEMVQHLVLEISLGGTEIAQDLTETFTLKQGKSDPPATAEAK